MIWLLLAQLFVFPVTNAYAVQIKKDVVISVTYTETLPIEVCTYAYSLDDVELSQPTATHCWKPESPIGDFDTWKDERIDMVNFKVVVRYPTQTVEIYLTQKLNS